MFVQRYCILNTYAFDGCHYLRDFYRHLFICSDDGPFNGGKSLTISLYCRTGGPTVLIIKDKEGHIYGGYASQPWERHADFYGDMKSFLFQLYPRASIFRPTGANHNLQWVSTMNLMQLKLQDGNW